MVAVCLNQAASLSSCVLLHLSRCISPLISCHPSRAKEWHESLVGEALIVLDTQEKSILIVRKGRKREDLDFEDRLLKLKLQIPGQEHWHTLFSAAHHPVSILGSSKAQLSSVTA